MPPPITAPSAEGASPPPRSWRAIERSTMREVLMGAQDNLTNVLSVVLGVTIGAGRVELVALAGLAAGVAEAISMAGVLYTSTRAEGDLARGDPTAGTPRLQPWQAGGVTFVAGLVGGLVPLVPFAFLAIGPALATAMVTSVAALFGLGAWTATITGRRWRDEGIRLVLIAGAAAVAAAVIGSLLRVD